MSQDNAAMLSELYEMLGVENQQDALNAIADLKTIKNSMEVDIHAILNFDFGVHGCDLRDKSTSEKLQMLSTIGKRTRTLTNFSKNEK